MTQFQAKPHIRFRSGVPVMEYRVPSIKAAQQLYPAQSYASFLSCVRDPYPGAWQQNQELNPRTALCSAAIYHCITLIAGDGAKLRPMLTEQQGDDTWLEVNNSPLLPVLRKPNRYQTRSQFWREWFTSKLIHGNTYVLKERDNRGLTENQGVVRALYVLNPSAVTVLVADNGDVFYRLGRDNLAKVDDNGITVPASEVIHDRSACFWHPLIGVPPLYAAALSASHGLTIQQNQAQFFANMSRPSGLLTSPNRISQATADRLQTLWQENFSGTNIGRLAVMGDGLKYEAMTIPPQQAQLAEQLGWTERNIAMAFGLPPYKMGLAAPVAFATAAQMNQDYYDQCLGVYLEESEQCMDDGLSLPFNRRIEFDTDGLLRMDPAAMADTDSKLVGSAIMKPNEARMRRNLQPVMGGDDCYLQQQNYSLPALAKRDAKDDPFAKDAGPAPEPPPADGAAKRALAKALCEMEFA